MSPIFWTLIFLSTLVFFVFLSVLLYYFNFGSVPRLSVSSPSYIKWMW